MNAKFSRTGGKPKCKGKMVPATSPFRGIAPGRIHPHPSPRAFAHRRHWRSSFSIANFCILFRSGSPLSRPAWSSTRRRCRARPGKAGNTKHLSTSHSETDQRRSELACRNCQTSSCFATACGAFFLCGLSGIELQSFVGAIFPAFRTRPGAALTFTRPRNFYTCAHRPPFASGTVHGVPEIFQLADKHAHVSSRAAAQSLVFPHDVLPFDKYCPSCSFETFPLNTQPAGKDLGHELVNKVTCSAKLSLSRSFMGIWEGGEGFERKPQRQE